MIKKIDIHNNKLSESHKSKIVTIMVTVMITFSSFGVIFIHNNNQDKIINETKLIESESAKIISEISFMEDILKHKPEIQEYIKKIPPKLSIVKNYKQDDLQKLLDEFKSSEKIELNSSIEQFECNSIFKFIHSKIAKCANIKIEINEGKHSNLPILLDEYIRVNTPGYLITKEILEEKIKAEHEEKDIKILFHSKIQYQWIYFLES